MNTLVLTSLLTFATTCLPPRSSFRPSSPSQSLSIQAEGLLHSVLKLEWSPASLFLESFHHSGQTFFLSTLFSAFSRLDLLTSSHPKCIKASVSSLICWSLITLVNLGNHNLKPAHIHRSGSSLPYNLDCKWVQICLFFYHWGFSSVVYYIS